MSECRVAVDAMGGDAAPGVVVEGVIEALKNKESKIILVGREKDILKEFKKNQNRGLNKVEIIDALEEISMKEQFLSYWRKREQTSIKKALDLVKDGRAEAMVSAGNTGAVMALAKTVLGPLPNVERPALMIKIPTLKGSSYLLDAGANVDSKPKNLIQYAIMGKVFLENVAGIPNPRVALMSVGEEEVKGNELTKITHGLLKRIDLNFIGNVEGRDVYMGEADLIVTDGFTGNVTLKVAEGVVEVMLSMLKREIMSNIFSKIGFFFLKKSLKRIKNKMDYSEYGGALLMGVNGIVIIGHGRSNAKAIMNAIRMSQNFISQNILGKVSGEIEKSMTALRGVKYE